MKCASVTVTFGPDQRVLCNQIAALPKDWTKVIVDNGTPDEQWGSIAEFLGPRDDVTVLRLGVNKGLGAAQNAGMRWLEAQGGASHVLLLDQDSEPTCGSASELAETFRSLEARGRPVGAVGPLLVDPVGGHRHKFHLIDGWRWRRMDRANGEPIRCSGINGSGTFMSIANALSLGGMDEALFIDLLDAEWSFRLTASGLELYGVPESVFMHRMGERTAKFWLFGWHVWPVRTPFRHRYLFRNTVLLLRRDYVPLVWKTWAVVKLMLTAAVFGAFGPERSQQLRAMGRGLVDGLLKRSGAIR